MLDELRAAATVLGPATASARLAVFSKGGSTAGLRERAAADGVHLVDVAQIYA